MKKYKDITIEGAHFLDDPYRITNVKLNDTVINEYLPALKQVLPNGPKGLAYLATIMTQQEGFTKGSRSYRTNNPGNISNTDAGSNHILPTLADGIKLQLKHLQDVANGLDKNYPIDKDMNIKPYYSPEIASHPEYGLPANLPGYHFRYSGTLEQFIKIYSTGARATNVYINNIVSYFHINGLNILPDSKLIDIIKLN